MTFVVLFARVLLATVFAAAAAGKVTSRASTGSIVATYDLSATLRRLVPLLPVAELAVAAGLVMTPTSRLAALAAAALLFAFSAFLARNLARGRAGGCNCFGASPSPRSTPAVGPRRWLPLARNGVLAAAAVVVVATASHGAAGSGGEVLLPLFPTAGVLVSVLSGTLARRRGVATTFDPEGAIAPGPALDISDVAVETLAGEATTLSALRGAAARVVLVFVDPGCGPCQSVVPALRTWAGRIGTNRLLVVSGSTRERAAGFLEGMAAGSVLLDPASELARRYAVAGTPGAVLLSPDLARPERTALGGKDVELLLRALSSGRVAHLPARVRALSRREVLAATGMGTTLAVALAACGGGPSASSKAAAKARTCPSCGTCADCNLELDATTGKSTLKCAPCAKKCSTAKLCKSYAGEYASYGRIEQHLLGQGLSPRDEPKAVALSNAGTTVGLVLFTPYARGSGKSPSALLTYGLTNGGQVAAALYLKGKTITSVVVDTSSGLKSATVSPSDVPTASSAVLHADRTAIELDAGDCCDNVSYIFDGLALALGVTIELAMEALVGAFAAESTVALAALMAGYLIDSAAPGTNLGSLASMLTAADLVDAAGKAGAYALNTAAGNTLKDAVCSKVCAPTPTGKLKACCNYSGACFDSDAVCEAHCTGGLAHPLSHCDVYINGKKVSQVIPG